MHQYSVGQASGGPASAGAGTATSSAPSSRRRTTWTTSASLIQRTLVGLDASKVENRKVDMLTRVFLVLALLQLHDGKRGKQFILYDTTTLRSGAPFHEDGAYPMVGECSAKLARAAALAGDGSCRAVSATVALVVRAVLRRNATLGATRRLDTINPDVVSSVVNTVVDVSAPTGNSWEEVQSRAKMLEAEALQAQRFDAHARQRAYNGGGWEQWAARLPFVIDRVNLVTLREGYGLKGNRSDRPHTKVAMVMQATVRFGDSGVPMLVDLADYGGTYGRACVRATLRIISSLFRNLFFYLVLLSSFFLGKERFVPPTDPKSFNHRLMYPFFLLISILVTCRHGIPRVSSICSRGSPSPQQLSVLAVLSARKWIGRERRMRTRALATC